jgi:hypothetical protein
MTLNETERERAAWLLRGAERDRTPVSPLGAYYPGFDVQDAYTVQRRNINHRGSLDRIQPLEASGTQSGINALKTLPQSRYTVNIVTSRLNPAEPDS